MENTLILKIGGEGGSIKFFQINEYFTYTTNESALMDLLNKDDKEGIEFKSKSKLFDTFDLAMESMQDRYPIFRLYPLEINNEFKQRINKYYRGFLLKNKKDEICRNNQWERILSSP